MKEVTQLHSNHMANEKGSIFTNNGYSASIILVCTRPTRLDVDEFVPVAPNQRRTETGIGTQCPPGLAVLVHPRKGLSSRIGAV